MGRADLIAILIFSMGSIMGGIIGFWQGCQYPEYKKWKAGRHD
jgi:membrane protein YqaA with SNARE-associated domain